MPEEKFREDGSSLIDTVERIRKERFPDLDADLVREIMILHADPEAASQGLARAVDEAIAKRIEDVT